VRLESPFQSGLMGLAGTRRCQSVAQRPRVPTSACRAPTRTVGKFRDATVPGKR
jgi:hypothetical protein